MRIDRLDLTRFGKFTDHQIAFPAPAAGAPDLHVIYGPNEAGKSTLMAGWLDLLFGIETRSPYDFIHDYKDMMIGAVLSENGQAQEFRRIKKKTGTLLDGHGAILPDTALLPLIGTLTRESYRQMFSLNDATIEEGGDDILASKGELGEMLFAASAGLAGLSPRLEALRQELDAFHQERKTATRLGEMRRKLADLAKAEKDADVPVQKLRQMQADLAATERQLMLVRKKRDDLGKHLATLEKIEDSLPRQQRLADKRAAYAAVESLHHGDESLPLTVEKLQAAKQALALEKAEAEEELQKRRLTLADQEGIADPKLLELRAAIMEAEAMRAAHDTALDDLPRREEEADTLARAITRHLAALGVPDRDAAAVILPPARLALLRALLRDQSGIVAAQQAATAELEAAQRKLASAAEDLGEDSPGDTVVLAAVLADLRQSDPQERLRRAHEACDAQRLAQDNALSALRPWSGDIASLQSMSAPTAAQLEAWAGEAKALSQEIDRHLQARGILDTQAQDLERTSQSGGDSTITLADAAHSRSKREDAWARHRTAPDDATAQAFEQAMREDDQVQALVLEAMVEARRDAVTRMQLMQLQAEVRAHDAAIADLRLAQRAAQEAQEARCASLGLPALDIATLTEWCALREAALRAGQDLRAAQDAVSRSEAGVAEAAAQLAHLLGAEVDALPVLVAKARVVIDQSTRIADARKRLKTLKDECDERAHAAAQAQKAFDDWQAAWREAVTGTLLAESRDDAGALVDRLDLLAQDHGKWAELADRIAKMQANVGRFADAAGRILDGVPPSLAQDWDGLRRALSRAENAATMAAREREEVQRLQGKLLLLEQRHAKVLAEEAELASTCGWQRDSGMTLAQHVARCCDATRLRQEIMALEQDLATTPVLPEGAGELSLELIHARDLVTEAESELSAAMAAHLAAKAALDGLGSDAAQTRIAAEREALLLDMKDRVRSHLQQRFALTTFEAALRRFRDLHQSAMLTEASQAFARLTGGAYRGLAAQPQGHREVLVAQTPDGLHRDATQMSKGTRFQLYLALRMAGYHTLASSRSMVPFIADDIMETFDDDRALATFSLLGEMARKGQVIYLTHHKHLCDLAQRACPSARITQL